MTIRFTPHSFSSKSSQVAEDAKFSQKAEHSAADLKERISQLKKRPWSPQVQSEITKLNDELKRMEQTPENMHKKVKAPNIFDGLKNSKITSKDFWASFD